jgi:hypothetical protein
MCAGPHYPNPPQLLKLARALNMAPTDLDKDFQGGSSVEGFIDITPEVKDAGEGKAYVRLGKKVTWEQAIEIMRIIQDKT